MARSGKVRRVSLWLGVVLVTACSRVGGKSWAPGNPPVEGGGPTAVRPVDPPYEPWVSSITESHRRAIGTASSLVHAVNAFAMYEGRVPESLKEVLGSEYSPWKSLPNAFGSGPADIYDIDSAGEALKNAKEGSYALVKDSNGDFWIRAYLTAVEGYDKNYYEQRIDSATLRQWASGSWTARLPRIVDNLDGTGSHLEMGEARSIPVVGEKERSHLAGLSPADRRMYFICRLLNVVAIAASTEAYPSLKEHKGVATLEEFQGLWWLVNLEIPSPYAPDRFISATDVSSPQAGEYSLFFVDGKDSDGLAHKSATVLCWGTGGKAVNFFEAPAARRRGLIP